METVRFFVCTLGIAGMLTLGLFLHVSRYRMVMGVALFRGLMLAATIWSWAYAMELLQPTVDGKLFWLNVQQVGILPAPVFWLSLALAYTGRNSWVQGMRRFYWFSVPAAAILLIWTNEYHHLMRVNVHLLELNAIRYVAFDRTALSWVVIGYAYAMLAATAGILTSGLLKRRLYRRQLAVLLVSFLLPTLVNAAQALGYNPLHPLGPTALFFAPAGLLICWGLHRYQLFTVWPVARDLVIETMNDGILVTNVNRQVVDLNPKAQYIIAAGQESDVKARKWRSVSEVLAAWPDWVTAYDQLEQQRCEIRLSIKQGPMHYLVRLNPLMDSGGSMIGSLAVIQDNTEQQRREEELLRLATIDQLTEIPNRRHFWELSHRIYALCERQGVSMSVLVVDVDRFKAINDSFGHQTGDLVLAHVAAVFQRTVRRADVVGRLGGEEFAFSLAAAELGEAKRFARRLMDEIGKLRVDGGSGVEIGVTVSVGVATQGAGDRNVADVLSRADRAMYVAKQHRNTMRTEEDLHSHAVAVGGADGMGL
jgi:diguanylate cyclase